jgi:molybdopterin converting factor small subunit
LKFFNKTFSLELTGQKEQLALEGRYLEAENVKNKINELKNNMSGQKKRDLTYQHQSEMQNLEENYNKEIFELNTKWEQGFAEFNDRAKKTDENINERHKAEMDDLVSRLDAKLPKQVKFSREYLDLKQSEINLVKQDR